MSRRTQIVAQTQFQKLDHGTGVRFDSSRFANGRSKAGYTDFHQTLIIMIDQKIRLWNIWYTWMNYLTCIRKVKRVTCDTMSSILAMTSSKSLMMNRSSKENNSPAYNIFLHSHQFVHNHRHRDLKILTFDRFFRTNTWWNKECITITMIFYSLELH